MKSEVTMIGVKSGDEHVESDRGGPVFNVC